MRTCSIVIPVFNKASLTRQCLDILGGETHPGIEVEVIVVDDGSTDQTAEALAGYGSRIQVIRHEANAGFAQSCNDGARQARGEYIVFLNNDTIPHAGWLDALIAYADQHPEAAVVGSKLLYPNGMVQHAGVVICEDRYPGHLYAGFPGDHPAVNKSRRFQIVTAACALFRAAVFREAGGFDTAYHNGVEDVDLCLRLGQKGYQVHYCHESVLTHLESASRQLSSDERANNHLYMERWGQRVQPDDFRYYLDDGLIRIVYNHEMYPMSMIVSPLLFMMDEEKRRSQADLLLAARARQVFGFLRDTIRLTVQLEEAKLRAEPAGRNGKTASKPPEPMPADPQLVCRGQVHWLHPEPSSRVVSVILPVKNGAAKLRRLLPKVLSQQTRDRIELVAIDSGSTDDTVEVLRQARATVLAINPRDFDHGLTRNLGARHATGEVLVFLNQGAVPADDNWLTNLLAPLDADATVAGVCSRTQPREDADLLTRFDVLRDEDSSPERQVRAIPDQAAFLNLPHYQRRLAINFHTISAAIRPEVLRRIPFPRCSSARTSCGPGRSWRPATRSSTNRPRSCTIPTTTRWRSCCSGTSTTAWPTATSSVGNSTTTTWSP
jgi:GT2 family glycosyltransferase